MGKFTFVALLAIAAMVTSGSAMAQTGITSIATSFTTADIPAGRQIWFAASLKVTGTPTYPLTIYFHHQTVSCTAFSLSVPDGELILDPSYTHATTFFDGTKWVTTSPPDEPGNYFIAAGQYSSSLVVPGGQNPVTWSGTFTASRAGVSLNWQWWCASYYGFIGPIYEDGTKASDCSSCTEWAGPGHAGTPQYVDHIHDHSELNEFTGGGTGYSYTDSTPVVCSEVGVAAVAISASATSVCTGDSVTFTASAVNGGATPSYQWKLNGVNVGANSPTYTLKSPVDGAHISVFLTSSDPLATTPTALSNLIAITVNSAPGSVTIAGGVKICTGGTSSFSASSGGGVWSSSNTAIGTVSSSGSVKGLNAGTVTLSYALVNSCGASFATKKITVADAFNLKGTLTSPTCNGYTNGSVITSVSPRGGHTYAYAWSDGSGSYGRWGVAAGTYSVRVTNEVGCVQTATYTLTQPAPLASTSSVTNVYPAGARNGAIYFGVSGGTWPYIYSWSSGAKTQNITGLSAGDYVVTTTDANSCTLTNWFGVRGPHDAAGKMASNASTGGAAFPNPFSTETTITFSAVNNGNTIVDVYSAVTGEKVATVFNEETHAGQEYSCKFSGGYLASGVYLYKIISADMPEYTGRIVLAR